MALIEAIQLSKRFASVTALHEVSLTVAAGEVVGFLGENGAGKSTTMKILTGALAPSGGSARVDGHDVVADSLAARQRIGYLPEEPPLYLDMGVASYLDHVARLKGIDAHARRLAVVDAMAAADVTQHEQRPIRQLSKGNRQRVGLAQALLGRPPVLILDEPTSGLDPTQVGRFRELVKSLAERHGVLISTHILAEVEAMCSRVVVIHRGRTVAAATVEELRRRSGCRLRLRVAGDPSAIRERLGALPGITIHDGAGDTLHLSVPDDRRGDLVLAVGADLRELVEERRGLDEIFHELVTDQA